MPAFSCTYKYLKIAGHTPLLYRPPSTDTIRPKMPVVPADAYLYVRPFSCFDVIVDYLYLIDSLAFCSMSIGRPNISDRLSFESDFPTLAYI